MYSMIRKIDNHIKENNIEIKVPMINGIKPSNATVYSLKNIEYNFDKEAQKLVIDEKNIANEQNEVLWSEMSETQYEVTFIYTETAISEEAKLDVDVISNVKVYSYDEQEFNVKHNNEITLKEKLGEIVDTKVESTEMVSKGYMYANYNKEQKSETEYKQIVTTNISLPELVDEISIKMSKDSFTNETEIGVANSYYKNIKLSKSKIL